jgi:hypothetical protein
MTHSFQNSKPLVVALEKSPGRVLKFNKSATQLSTTPQMRNSIIYSEQMVPMGGSTNSLPLHCKKTPIQTPAPSPLKAAHNK